jgi:hypothetical protein
MIHPVIPRDAIRICKYVKLWQYWINQYGCYKQPHLCFRIMLQDSLHIAELRFKNNIRNKCNFQSKRVEINILRKEHIYVVSSKE